MKIVSAPHPSLRQTAKSVEKVTPKLIEFISQLQDTLAKSVDSKGVGLAAPQVESKRRIFATQDEGQLAHFINPVVVSHSRSKILGPDEENYQLEGCLSIPMIYGPVPRWQWIEIEFQTLDNEDSAKLISRQARFDDFVARVIQHEIDHLDGILFTDYILELGLPVYIQNQDDKLVDLTDRSILEVF